VGTGESTSRPADPDVTSLLPIVQRIVGARVADPATAEDLVQETLMRVLAAADRIEPGMLEPYAIATAKNVVVTLWRDRARERRNLPRVLDLDAPDDPGEDLVSREEQTAVAQALLRLPEEDQQALIAHEVTGQDTRSLADDLGSTAGAVAARLNRTRARMRVEYLLALEGTEPPTDRCRSVLLALSGGESRRRREADADRHLLECQLCERLSHPLLERAAAGDGEVRIPVRGEDDVVVVRQRTRELAADLGFPRPDLTVLATAVTEVTDNILRFAGSGEVLLEAVEQPRPGMRIVARDAGPGIADVEQALSGAFSSEEGLGLGLPGVRSLMDDVTVDSDCGGTTVAMTKWCPDG
jgi:RNA polymerase sigma factor (sigma-70 family)